ncbi:hypothetical protein ACQ859_07075 [Roseateles chitinivorans]|uniref:hypothetical protein n=1 Tax=Roseateles chitinivorans TaxID=2917965 RepID=UPI003D679387
MGYTQAGLILKRSTTTDDPLALVERLTGELAEELNRQNPWPFDPRSHNDVLVQFANGACVITNHDLVWSILEDPDFDVEALHQKLGAPDSFMVFCRYDGGGTFGYAVVEQGRLVRRRLQTTGVPSLPPLTDVGEPLALEAPWLSAKFFYEDDEDEEDIPEDEREKILYLDDKDDGIPEYWLTCRLLEKLLEERYGVIPWDLGNDPQDRFLRMRDRWDAPPPGRG